MLPQRQGAGEVTGRRGVGSGCCPTSRLLASRFINYQTRPAATLGGFCFWNFHFEHAQRRVPQGRSADSRRPQRAHPLQGAGGVDRGQHRRERVLLAALTPTVAHCSGAIYVAMSSSELDVLQAAFRAAGGKRSTFIIWAMKPVELVDRAIRNSSRPGSVVLDPFAGSGTTLIAAEKSGRIARLIELEPKYVDVIVRRWEEFTGKQAIREVADQKVCTS